ncbi:conserved hypothetical protein, secreted [mine drainage metagenome]|uniref:Uncharacterized protein n=1 Tax=mine drainage metagenome TaxID=410659 RepID=T1B6A8_9ZZZZ
MKFSSSHTHNFLIKYGGLAGVAVLAVAGFAYFAHLPAPSELAPTPTPTVAPVHPAVPAHPASVAHASSAATTPVVLGPVMLPAQPMPRGLRQGYAQRAIASSPAPATYGDHPVWTALATAAEPSPTGSWSTAIPASLRAISPSSGLVQTTITAYVRVQNNGAHVLILSVSGGPAKAVLIVDGQAAPLAQIARTCNAFMGCPQNAATGAGSVDLAAGLHVLTVTVQATVGDQAATLDVYMRGPGAAMPTAITPWAVPAGAAGTTTAAKKAPTCWRPSMPRAEVTRLPPCAMAGAGGAP